jgi:ribosomal protein S18 acetylase RimI-like enzyme
MSSNRVSSRTGRLVRLGFQDAERSAQALDRLGPVADDLVHLVASAADPDQAAGYLADLADRVQDRKRLLDALVDECRDVDAERLWLEVRLGNVDAQRTYLRLGFVKVGVRKGYYPAPFGRREDAVVMSLQIGAVPAGANDALG